MPDGRSSRPYRHAGDLPTRREARGAVIDPGAVRTQEVVDEVSAHFAAYEDALIRGSTAEVNAFFWSDDEIVRFGIADRQRGYRQLAEWRATQSGLPGRRLADTVITTFGPDFAVVTTLFSTPDRPMEGRQSQVWARLADGWRIVSAHVSEVPARDRDEVAAEKPADDPGDAEGVILAVIGAHLRGQPLNGELVERRGRFVEQTTTSRCYRLYAMATEPPKPALVRSREGGNEIEVELWSLPRAEFGTFVARVPPPLAIGSIELGDGRWVPGFVGQPEALVASRDITDFGGWRRFLGLSS